jgi:hypothetical protein
MICFAIGECQAKTSLYSPHDGDLSFIVSNLVIDKNGSDNDSLPRRAQKKSRTKRDSINATEVKGKADSGEAILTENLANDSTSTDSTIVASNSDYIDFLPGDTIPLTPIKAEKVFEAELETIEIPKKQFIPDPGRALWLSAVFPGAGQIYNRKYWKLPIFYGGFLGCTYALLWNQQMYMDYSQAYLDIMDDNPNTNSHLEMLPPRYDITGKEERFKTIFKNKKNYYRRYRDLSAFCFVGVYLLSIVDAYVDAHLSIFDISPDLSLQVQPAIIESKGLSPNNSYGVGCSFNF